jgi:hypothetical protein
MRVRSHEEYPSPLVGRRDEQHSNVTDGVKF